MRINVNQTQTIFPEQSSKLQPLRNPVSIQMNRDKFNPSGLGSSLAGKLRASRDFSILDPSGETDPILKLMNNAIKEVGKVLEEMKILSEQAESEDLSDEERLDMQIQMTRLQATLYKKTHGMALDIAGKQGDLFSETQLDAIDYDEKLTIKMLERERARMYGEGKTEKAEQTLLMEDRVPLKVERDPESWGLTEIVYDEASGKYVPGKSREDLGGGTTELLGFKAKKLIESGSVMTDEERMAKNTLSLLDAKSAQESTKKIESQIKGLMNMQDQLKEAIAKPNTASTEPSDPEQFFLNDALAGNSVMTSLGMMQATQDEYQKNPLKGRDLEAADVRIVDASNPTGMLLQKLDAFFKDKVHKRLGLGGMWDSQQNITFA